MENEKIGYRVGVILSLIIAVVWIVVGIVIGGYGIIGGLVLAYMSISFGMQLGHDTVVDDIFFWAWSKSIDMPGVIFELDVDGILFFIAYKLIIAPIITFILMLVVGLFGTLIAILLSIFTFPFTIFRIVSETF